MAVLRRRLLGLVFFLVLALVIGGSILKFNQTFSTFTDVTLTTDSAGNALPNNADVKVRGVLVGQVREVTTRPDGTVAVKLGLDPDKAKMLSAGTTARILPKTLFGERYVALQLPAGDSGEPLRNGATIATDSTGNAMELQTFFDKLLPVLKAIPPQDLSVTLGALAKALDGNGEKLGASFEELNNIFTQVNANMPQLQGTLRGLATFSQTYSQALPDIVDSLDTLRTTTNTLVEKQGDLKTLISTVTATAIQTTDFLRTNRRDLLTLAIDSEPLLTALATHSPAFGCTFKNFAGLVPEVGNIVGVGTKNPGVRVNLSFSNPRGRYLPNQDEPRLLDDRGPRCYPQHYQSGRPFPQYPGGSLNDGSYQPPSRNPGPRNLPTLPIPDFSGKPAGVIQPSVYDDPQNKVALQAIMAAEAGVNPGDVPSWIAQIVAPGLQGAQVTIK
ncbi:MCE family protein [Williamsia sp. CHRR-6]|uniref:MCE family protein n=1 Tax=Williamsia sp. CHRR-6 TaxID=2835871 RepID=UPI001BDA7620|nr:MCE family protein [Williamsia sp. CHRR-6]MBT0565881.1 MCE family protein [Williamsia sp. CHRR-6]